MHTDIHESSHINRFMSSYACMNLIITWKLITNHTYEKAQLKSYNQPAVNKPKPQDQGIWFTKAYWKWENNIGNRTNFFDIIKRIVKLESIIKVSQRLAEHQVTTQNEKEDKIGKP